MCGLGIYIITESYVIQRAKGIPFCNLCCKKKYKIDIKDNKKALRRVRTASERAKRILSSSTQANIDIDSLHDGVDVSIVLTRAKFESLCADIRY